MTKQKSTKRALLLSAVSLLLCASMFVGSTFAWFTDTVSSGRNIIQSGNLDVEMYWAEGKTDPANTTWTDASTGAMFKADVLWEPGYTEARHIKIANVGSLAFKYQMRILANGVVTKLANVIDVYYFDEATQLDRTKIANATKLGTLSEVLNNTNLNAISAKVAGNLEASTEKVVTIVFKMQESAGNEYQNLSIGTDFSIQLLATQYTSESDSFNNQYDVNSDFAAQNPPSAMVYKFDEQTAKNLKLIDLSKNPIGTGLDTAYSFQPTESYAQSLTSEYGWAHADFFVYADKMVPANSMMLAGYYSLFGDFLGIDDSTWIGLTADTDVNAGEANGIRLLRDGMGGTSIAYSEICNYGNDGVGFLCGAADVTGVNAGTTLTVELRLYEAKCDDPGCHHNSMDCETGEYITIGTFTYTFPSEVVSNATELAKALEAKKTHILLANDCSVGAPIVIDYDVTIVGDGTAITREDGYTGTVFTVAAGASLTLEDVTVDGGAVWTSTLADDGAVTNSGAVATGNLIAAEANAKIILGEGSVLQNNDGAHAVNLGTRIGATLTLNGGEIIYNRSDSGAVWGGGHITINSGKISYNSSTGIGGAIRMVSNCNLTMNGGEISNNTATSDGGAIWGYGSSTYKFNGGEMSNNTAGGIGGAIYLGTYSPVHISGDFKMCNNTATTSGAVRFTDHTSLYMSGGEISGNISTENANYNGFYGWDVYVEITGGVLEDDITINSGLTPAVGGGDVTGIIHFAVKTNHNTVNLIENFGTFKFTVAEGNNFAAFNLKPAASYVYTEGDEAKLVCMNEGYTTYWNAEKNAFCLKAE